MFLLLVIFFPLWAFASAGDLPPVARGPMTGGVAQGESLTTTPVSRGPIMTRGSAADFPPPVYGPSLPRTYDIRAGDPLAKFPADEANRPRGIWEQPTCPPCPPNSGLPIAYGRGVDFGFVKIRPYGYIKWEAYWDTRQPIGSREEQAFLYPRPPLIDIYGQDINAHGKWDMLAIESRIGIALEGPSWGEFATDGLIEGDFRGPSDTVTSTFRLRQAFGRILWAKKTASILLGQWWHPLFILECYPHTVAFAIGAPMEAQARDPQVRYTQRWGAFELITAAASQTDFPSPGPVGSSPVYIRNAVIPNLHLQMRGYFGDNNLVGIAGDYKRLVPRIQSDLNIKVNEYIDSFIFEAFAAYVHPPWSFRTKVFWAQNGTDQQLISGYGVRTVNPITDERTYSNTAATGAWFDFSYLFYCDSMELGFFAGGTKNLGSKHALYIDPTTNLPIIYALTGNAQNLDYVTRFSPRYVFRKDPVRVGFEVEWTRASWGTPNRFGKVRNGVPVDNIRILLALFYMF